MITYEQALSFIHSSEVSKPIALPITDALGYIAAKNIASKVFIPPFTNSAMDGFAVRSKDVINASKKEPVLLDVKGSSIAGDTPSKGSGGAWEIMTGAPMPQGYDAVIKVEDVIVDKKDHIGKPQRISVFDQIATKSNVRDAGSDLYKGDIIIKKGTALTSFHIMALATIGEKIIEVYPKPKVAIFTTGKEIIDDVDTPLSPGQIRDSNGPYLKSALTELGAQAFYKGAIHDEPEIFEEKIQRILPEYNIIISTGAVSAGRHDFIPESLRKLGAKTLFHKVAIRPGKPILYARFANNTHYFGLPGNPVSAAVGLRFFVLPLLNKLQGIDLETPITVPLSTPYSKKANLRFFCKAQLSINKEKKLQVQILQGQESYKIHPLLESNCWASLSGTQHIMKAGHDVEVYPLMPGSWRWK